ncbi:MAG TPA: hypothetical protein VEO91_08155 [Candidatus Limnocylindria bacterium]|nr:hypothetical protein [Candidatus Limnocylindria bacterium]
MTLEVAIALLASWLIGLRYVQRSGFERIRSGSPGIGVLCIGLGAYYCLPLLLAPILGLTDWSVLVLGIYIGALALFAGGFRLIVWAVAKK